MAAWRYYRLYCTTGNTSNIIAVAEVELLDINSTDVTQPSTGAVPTTATANGTSSGSAGATIANDGTTSAWQYNAVYPHWLQYDLGLNNAQEVVSYKIQATATPAYAPAAWSLQGSQDGSNWATIDSQTGRTWTASEVKTFSPTFDQKVLSGTVLDSADSPLKRVVRVTNRNSGAIVGETESSASTGAWSIDVFGQTNNLCAQVLDVETIEQAKTVFSCRNTGTNGSTTFTDLCGHTLTANGNAAVSTADYPSLTGVTSSLYCDGTGDSVTSAPSPDAAVGQDDFVLECYGKLTSSAGDNYRYLIDLPHPAGEIAIRYGNSGFGYKLQFYVLGTAVGNVYSCAKTQSADVNVWQLLTIERYRGRLRFYVNGTAQSFNSGVNPGTYPNTSIYDTTLVQLPYVSVGSGSWLGYIGPWRFLRYSPYKGQNFTPPTAPWASPVGVSETWPILDVLTAQ